MNISEQQLNNMMAAVSVALQPLVRVVPMTAVEWADQNYYLPKESSYGEGEWKTLPFQIAIMNCMGNDQVRTVNLIKSARVGYTKMLLGVVGYQIRIRGEDTAPEAVYARLHEQLGEGTIIHIVPRLAGAGKGGLQIVLGAAAIVGSFFTAGATMALWGSALAAGGFSATTMLFSLGASMILGGVAQMLAPKAKTPDYRATDNGRQNTYFSSLDNMIAQGNPMPVPYGEMLVGSRRISQDISTRDEGGDGKVVVIGRQA